MSVRALVACTATTRSTRPIFSTLEPLGAARPLPLYGNLTNLTFGTCVLRWPIVLRLRGNVDRTGYSDMQAMSFNTVSYPLVYFGVPLVIGIVCGASVRKRSAIGTALAISSFTMLLLIIFYRAGTGTLIDFQDLWVWLLVYSCNILAWAVTGGVGWFLARVVVHGLRALGSRRGRSR
jgi:hypothetical protein